MDGLIDPFRTFNYLAKELEKFILLYTVKHHRSNFECADA